jgi:hypothetical protein
MLHSASWIRIHRWHYNCCWYQLFLSDIVRVRKYSSSSHLYNCPDQIGIECGEGQDDDQFHVLPYQTEIYNWWLFTICVNFLIPFRSLPPNWQCARFPMNSNQCLRWSNRHPARPWNECTGWSQWELPTIFGNCNRLCRCRIWWPY